MFNNVDVEYLEEGKIILYYQDQVVNITDKFQDGYCHVLVKGADGDLYVTVEYEGGWAASPDKYPEY